MDIESGHFCLHLLGIFISVCAVTGNHNLGYNYFNNYRYNYYYYYYYYYYETDGNASLYAGSIIGGLIALCVLIAVIVVLAHAFNCCKTHGVRGHTIRPAPISAITTSPTTTFNNIPRNDWYYLPPTAPPYQPQTTKLPPQYSSTDSNPPPAYDEISRSAPPANTRFPQPGPSTPAPPYSPPRPEQKP